LSKRTVKSHHRISGEHLFPCTPFRHGVRSDLGLHIAEVVGNGGGISTEFQKTVDDRRHIRLEVEVEHLLTTIDPAHTFNLDDQRLPRFGLTMKAVH